MKQLIVLFFTILGALPILHAQCTEDCVWPGDLNANGIANNLDILALGFAINETGPPRSPANNDWEAMEVDNWTGNLPFLGANFKHCDANGDGLISTDDQFPISINYNKTNPNFTGLLGNNLVGDDLFLVPQNNTTSPGGSYFIDVHLGRSGQTIDGIYGIGFQVLFDTQYVAEVKFDFSESWLGMDEEIFAYGKYSDQSEHAGTAITRLDGTPVSGFGKIAQMEIVITDVVLGLVNDTTACLPFSLQFENVLGINEFEEDLMIRAKGDSLKLKHPSQIVSTQNIENQASNFSIYPNPVQDILHLKTDQQKIQQLVLYNQLGQNVYQKHISQKETKQQHFQITTTQLPRGIYFLSIETEASKHLEKLVLQ